MTLDIKLLDNSLDTILTETDRILYMPVEEPFFRRHILPGLTCTTGVDLVPYVQFTGGARRGLRVTGKNGEVLFKVPPLVGGLNLNIPGISGLVEMYRLKSDRIHPGVAEAWLINQLDGLDIPFTPEEMSEHITDLDNMFAFYKLPRSTDTSETSKEESVAGTDVYYEEL